jgi:hypothetical protein
MIIKALSDMAELRPCFQAIELKRVNFSCDGRAKKRGIKFEGKSAEVIENTCRKNVNFCACAEVTEDKRS